MKKSLLLAGLLATQFAFAQQKNHALEVGINAGTSLSSLLNAKSPFTTLRPRPGVQVGLTTALSAQYRFSRHFAVQTGLVYEEKGARVKASSDIRTEQGWSSTEFSRKVDNNYLTLPLLLGWQTTGQLGFGVWGGGFVSRLVHSGIRGKESKQSVSFQSRDFPFSLVPPASGNTATSQFAVDGDSRTFSMDYGVSFGGSVFFPLNDKLKLSMNALLNVSLRKLDKTHDNDYAIVSRQAGFVKYEYDYFGLSSRARNISLPVHLGLSYRLF